MLKNRSATVRVEADEQNCIVAAAESITESLLHLSRLCQPIALSRNSKLNLSFLSVDNTTLHVTFHDCHGSYEHCIRVCILK